MQIAPGGPSPFSKSLVSSLPCCFFNETLNTSCGALTNLWKSCLGPTAHVASHMPSMSDGISSFKAKRRISWPCWLTPSDWTGVSWYRRQNGLEEGAWGGVTAPQHTHEQPVCCLPGTLWVAALTRSQGESSEQQQPRRRLLHDVVKPPDFH